ESVDKRPNPPLPPKAGIRSPPPLCRRRRSLWGRLGLVLVGAEMIHVTNLLPIVLMAFVTYLTRVVGYAVLRNRVLSPYALAVMDAASGCILISVIAPSFVSDQPADLIALAITLAAATRLSLLPTVIIGVASAGCTRIGRYR